MIVVALADDEPIMLEALRFSIDAEADMTVAGAFTDSQDLAEAARRQVFDIILLDIRMNGDDDLKILAELNRIRPHVPVALLSSFSDKSYIETALTNGVRGYLLKRLDRPQLLQAIRAIVDGGSVLAPEAASRLVADFIVDRTQFVEPDRKELGITERGYQVLMLAAKGFSNEEIAHELGIVRSTVKVHISKLMKTVGARSRGELVIYAFEKGFVRPQRYQRPMVGDEELG